MLADRRGPQALDHIAVTARAGSSRQLMMLREPVLISTVTAIPWSRRTSVGAGRARA